MRKFTDLNGEWNLYYCEKYDTDVKLPCENGGILSTKITANVPCNVETALAGAGKIGADLYKGMATEENMKFEDYHWWFEREFDVPETNGRIYLNFGMVDCFADYYINGALVHTSDNAFCEIEFDVSDFVKKGAKNTVCVHIKPVMPYVLSRKYNQGMMYFHTNYASYVRKSIHSFGWDIMPRAVSAGIYRDVKLVCDDGFNIDELSYEVINATEKSAYIRFWISVKMPYGEYRKDNEIKISGRCGDSYFEKTQKLSRFTACVMNIEVKNPLLWFPYGYGSANVYGLKAELVSDGNVKDIRTETLGIRTVRLERTETSKYEKGKFQFYINDVPVMCKGSNHVPVDAYHSRDKARYAKMLELAKECECNILRVWGGGVYEQKEFYDFCDRNGIMVWQDFMMACYPQSPGDEHMKKLEQEFEWAVKKLRNHPSIILWAGDNEVDECGAKMGAVPSTNYVTRTLLPKILAQHDRTRPYIESSPYIADSVANDYRYGKAYLPEQHLWGTRDYFKADFYSKTNAVFVSEEGYHGCPSVESLKKIVDENKLWPVYNEQWALHSSDQTGNLGRVKLMDEQIVQFFGKKAENIEDFSLASQISQAEADKFFIENIRTKKGETSGIIWWNLLDGWPQMSDAVVDYFYEKKLAFYYIKRSQQPFALMMGGLKNWNYPLYAENDTLETKSGTYEVSDIDTGEVLARGEFCIKPNSAEKIDSLRIYYSEKRFLVIKWNLNGKTFFNHYLCGYPPFDFEQYKSWLRKFNGIVNGE